MIQAKFRAVAAMILLLPVGCKELSQPLPAGVQDPKGFKTREGALALYRGALQSSVDGFLSYASASGRLTDELSDPMMYQPGYNEVDLLIEDRRQFDDQRSGGFTTMYIRLNAMRNNTMQSIQALQMYADSSEVLRAELYAMQGYADVMLAEGFCSGIPLSTVDFENDFTYHPGSSTQEVIQHAIALFDTAVALSGDSTRISYLARIGKARALLMSGSIETAAQTVAGIPESYQYRLPIGQAVPGRFVVDFRTAFGTVANREGQNGLPFVTSKDPRSASYGYGLSRTTSGDSLYVPRKYSVPTDQLAFVVADGIEVRLIEAEADLRKGQGSWLTKLNALRTNGTYVTSGGSDTVWNAGTGNVGGLRPLEDPVAAPLPEEKTLAEARIDMLFTERAYWMFLTGHRQGDLRRLVRSPYLRESNTVYPTGSYGPYGAILNLVYGDLVTFPVPKQERLLNPIYHGCQSSDA